jgi:L-amino acid N-acyltransferase YncA
MIRPVDASDAAAIAEIYRPSVESAVISFEYVAPTAAQIATRIATVTSRFPWLVFDDNGVIAGYAYASAHSERAAYGWAVNCAVYVAASHHRRGVGRRLYVGLFDLLKQQGYYKAYAGITLPNPASVGLHEALGFTPVGVYKGVGYKFGAWHDVIWYQLTLLPERPDPPAPVAITQITGRPA